MKTISWKQKGNKKNNEIFTEPEVRGQYSTLMVVRLSYWSGGGGGAKNELASQFQKAQGKVIFNMNHIHACVISKLISSVSC